MNRNIVCLLLAILATCNVSAQSKTLDSLLHVEQKHNKADTNLISLWNKIAYRYYQIDPAKGIEYADKAIGLSKKLNSRVLLADAYMVKASNALAMGHIDSISYLFDSSMNIYTTLNDKKGQASVLYSTANYYFSQSKLEKAVAYFHQSLEISRALHDDYMEELTLGSIGVVYLYLADYQKALDYSSRALDMAEKHKYLDEVGRICANLSYLSSLIGDFPQSIKYGLRSIEIARSRGDKANLAAGLINVGSAYVSIKQYKKGIDFLIEANNINKERGASIELAKTLYSIATAHAHLKNMQEAIKTFKEAISISEKGDNRQGVADNLKGLASVYYEIDSFDRSLKLYNQSLEIYEALKLEAGIATAKLGIATDLVKLGMFKTAYKPLNDCYQMFSKQGDKPNLNSTQHLFSDFYVALGKYDSAYYYYNKFVKLNDSLLSDENIQDIAHKEAQFEFSRKEDSLKLNQALADEKIARQHTELILKTNTLDLRESQLLLANKEKDLQYLAYQKTQLELSNSLAMTAEKEKEIRLAKLENEQQERNTQLARKDALLQAAAKRSAIYLSFSGFILLTAGVAFYMNRLRIRQLKKLVDVRTMIAANLHDEVGSTLSSISMMSQVAKKKGVEGDDLLDRISINSQNMLDSMSDIVWSIRPDNDKLGDIISRIRMFAAETLEEQSIKVAITVGTDIDKLLIPMEHRKDIYLIAKEAIINIAKYARATVVQINIHTKSEQLIVEIKDNGIGFDGHKLNTLGGNGLKNMQQRAGSLNGALCVTSKVNQGTIVVLTMPI